MEKKLAKLLFISAYNSTYVKTDLSILEKSFKVRTLIISNWKKNLGKISEIYKGVLWADISYIWFADFVALLVIFFSKLLKKKTVVVIAGYELTKIPEFKYGGQLTLISRMKIKYVLKNADRILTVSDFSKNEIGKFVDLRKVRMIHLGEGLDCEDVKNKKENLVVTVGKAQRNPRNIMKLKGLDTFVKAAKQIPEAEFVIIGEYDNETYNYLREGSSNIIFTGNLSKEQTLKWFRKAKVYCHLSYRESFGLALLEAMNCGCIPFVTSNGALPEVVGDTGYYVRYGDVEDTVKAINKALKSKNNEQARERAEEMFPLQKREEELNKIMKEIL
ncbi:MAG TPA: glycosyltransferase [Candidatus Cloacimonetes bacterium]|nr:glycosyltransferase [Candidatus Cloacimonadota bacterium]